VEAPAGTRLRAVFHQDFRLPGQELPFLRPVGSWQQQDAGGMRITIPAGEDQPRQGGFDTAFPLQGDFEVTTSFEVLRADQPTTGYGVGVGLYAPIDPTTHDAVSLSRRVKVNGQAEFISNRMRTVAGQLKHQVASLPATAATGQLRLQRVGPRMRFFVADGAEAPFVLLAEVELGTEDLPFVRVEADTGKSDSGLELRLLTLSVRAEQLPGGPTEESASPHNGGGRRWLAAVVLLSLVFLLLAIVGPMVRFGRRTRTILALLSTVPLGLGATLWFAWAGDGPAEQPAPAQEYHQPFHGKPADMHSYVLLGPEAKDRVRFEPDGLRITLPRGFPGRRQGTGLVFTTPVRGNFEINLDYEVLQGPDPADGGDPGTARLSLGVLLDTPESNDGSVSWGLDARRNPRFSSYLKLHQETSEKDQPVMHYFPAREKTGRLRLVRTGSVLSCYAAEGPQGEFTRLDELTFRALDIKKVYVTTSTTGANAELDVRVRDLRIRADALGAPVTAPPVRSKKWVLLAASAGLLTLVLLGVCWRLGRRVANRSL
jgi:hypothetical protein